LTVSVYIEPAARFGDGKAARELYLSRLQASPMPMKDVKFFDLGDFAGLQYVVPEMNRKHVNLYLSRDGAWIDVHLSAPLDPNIQSDPALEAVMKTVRVEMLR